MNSLYSIGHPTVVSPRSLGRTVKGERTHIPALDGLRGVAILLVVVVHTLPFQLTGYAGVHSALKNVLCSAGLGVQLFFVLSGFLISGILLDSKQSPNYFRNFYGRRVLRIFPLYYGVILGFWVIAALRGFLGDKLFVKELPWLFTYTSNVLMMLKNDWYVFNFGKVSIGHFWSLAVEEQFYLVWPAAVWFFSKTTLKWACLLAIPFAFGARVILLYAANNAAGAFVFTPCQLDSLAVGALLSVLVREREETVAAMAWPMALAGGLAWIVCCVDKNLLLTAGVTAFGVMSAGLLAICLYHPLGSVFANGPLRAFGKFSYAIYVFHVILLPFVVQYRNTFGLPLFILLFAALSFAAGWLSWHLFEKHFLLLKSFFPASTSSAWKPRLIAIPRPGN